MQIEDAFAKIIADNGLTSVSVGRGHCSTGWYFTANVHWDGFSSDGIACASGHDDVSAPNAIRKALAEAAGKRKLDIPAVPQIEIPA